MAEPRPRRGRSIEKDHPFNIDAQDRQDKKHETVRYRKQTRSMIVWVLDVIQEPESGFWEIRVGTEAMVELKTVETLAQ